MCYRYAELTCFSFHLNIVYVYIKPQSVERFEIGNIHFYFHCAPHWSSITWCGKHRHYNFHKSHLCITINCLILIFEFNQPSIKRWIKMHAFEYTYSIIANLQRLMIIICTPNDLFADAITIGHLTLLPTNNFVGIQTRFSKENCPMLTLFSLFWLRYILTCCLIKPMQCT